MTSEQKISIKFLKDYIKKIFFLYEELKEEKDNLVEKNQYLIKRLKEKEKKIKHLEHQYHILKLAKTFTSSEKDTAKAKQKINAILKEIDKCIALLNQ